MKVYHSPPRHLFAMKSKLEDMRFPLHLVTSTLESAKRSNIKRHWVSHSWHKINGVGIQSRYTQWGEGNFWTLPDKIYADRYDVTHDASLWSLWWSRNRARLVELLLLNIKLFTSNQSQVQEPVNQIFDNSVGPVRFQRQVFLPSWPHCFIANKSYLRAKCQNMSCRQ